MQRNTLKLDAAKSPALLVAPRTGGVEVAAFVTASGDRMVCNADLKPFSPVDGSQMQLLSSARDTFNNSTLRKTFVRVGKCLACESVLVATASLADAIDTAPWFTRVSME